jgi:hypothetical protein
LRKKKLPKNLTDVDKLLQKLGISRGKSDHVDVTKPRWAVEVWWHRVAPTAARLRASWVLARSCTSVVAAVWLVTAQVLARSSHGLQGTRRSAGIDNGAAERCFAWSVVLTVDTAWTVVCSNIIGTAPIRMFSPILILE